LKKITTKFTKKTRTKTRKPDLTRVICVHLRLNLGRVISG